jgi:succinate-acetate transporter protein
MRFDLARISTATKILLAAGILLFIDLFLHWQQRDIGPFTVSRTGWHGIGVLVGLLTIALIAWELLQALEVRVGLPDTVPENLISVALAVAVALFAIIEFFTHNEIRHWPTWIGLILALVIAFGGFLKFGETPERTTTPVTPPAA